MSLYPCCCDTIRQVHHLQRGYSIASCWTVLVCPHVAITIAATMLIQNFQVVLVWIFV